MDGHEQDKSRKIKLQIKGIREDVAKYTRIMHPAGDRGSSVVKVLCYKSEGLWFDSRWCYWNFS